MQFLADILPARVDRPQVAETTALGAAYLAGWRAGLYPEPEHFAESWALERCFTPAMAADERQRKLAGWHDAVRRTLSSTAP
jgi:glycerol kinase